MNPPADAIESESFVVWIDDGIIHIQTQDTPATGEMVAELVAATRELIDGIPMPVLFDFRQWREGGSVAWETLINTALSLFTAAAFVVAPELLPRMAAYPEIISRLLIPVEAFTDEAEAIGFLRGMTGSRPTSSPNLPT